MDPPYVNGVSPCEGHPGTQIKIWGENLGLSEHDITSIVICGHECIESMDWVSSRKIICNTGRGVGRGRIIITSSSGGVGTCSVYFSGLEPASPASPAIDPNAESDMWLEENWIVPGEQGDMGFHNIASDTPINRPTDPLGINMKRSAPGDTIRQFCPQGSSDLLSEDFNPVVFLLENHCTTSFNQLQSGLSNLKKEVHTSEEAPGQFIKDNLDSFIQCYDTLSDVNELLIRNETESESGSITDKMEILLRDTALQADALFQDLLNRKTKADSTRNALTVLQRYRFLFNLPRSIEMNIKHVIIIISAVAHHGTILYYSKNMKLSLMIMKGQSHCLLVQKLTCFLKVSIGVN
jgi:exocyst complex component 2